ncbi:MAG: TIGR02391 family protein [Candidatus Bathyarchaeota archaeon]|nr:TIGR02391 family protein [Candidatus Bathyarchaeota archaeon]
MIIPVFGDEQLRSLCAILGDTNEGLTNTEIEQLLLSASIDDLVAKIPKSPYYYIPVSKRDRLYEALSKKQIEDQCGNNVANFVLLAMKPVRYTSNKSMFESRLIELNKVLSFSGYIIGEDGQLRNIKRAETLSDAELRASRLKTQLISRNMHPDILLFCKAELLQDNYFHAVFEATKSVADKIRKKAGLDGDGYKLVEDAFGSQKGRIPKLVFNAFKTETEIMEQNGIVNLMKGMFGTFRNPPAHEPRISWPIEEQDALDLLSLASFLHRRIDASKRVSSS